MAFKISFNAIHEIVNVIYSGIASLEERIQAVEDVCASYGDLKPLKILVNVRSLEMHLPLPEQKKFGKFLADCQGLAHSRVAVLHKQSHNPNMLIDVIAFNNGYKLAEFIEQKDAEDWLVDI